MDIKIRIGERKDLEFLVEAQMAMAMESEDLILDMDILNNGINHLFDYPESGNYLIALFEDKPVACTLILNEWSDWRNGNVVWIHSVFVLPEYRKKGVFKKIYGHIKNSVQSNSSLKGIRLYVEKENDRAQKVYSRLGMDGEHYKLYEWLPEG